MGKYESLVAMMVLIISLALVVALVLYLICSITNYLALKRVGYDKAYLAFIPFANMWALTQVCYSQDGYIEIFGKKINKTWFDFYWAIMLAVSGIPYIGSIVVLLLRFFGMGKCMEDLYTRMDNNIVKDSNKWLAYIGAGFGIEIFFTIYKLISTQNVQNVQNNNMYYNTAYEAENNAVNLTKETDNEMNETVSENRVNITKGDM